MDVPLIWVRALHFAATLSLVGAVLFDAVVATPAFAAAGASLGDVAAGVRRWLMWIVSASAALALLSGVAWVLVQTSNLADIPWTQAMGDDALFMVLSDTGFGWNSMIRCVLLILLGTVLCMLRWPQGRGRSGIAFRCLLAMALAGTLAWTGHAAGTPGAIGGLHLCSDIVHLIAAAAWVGSLVPLAILLSATLAKRDVPSLTIARAAVMRFSTFAVVCVGAIVLTGLFNGWLLAGSRDAMLGTDYGRLLLTKVSLFAIMLCVAAYNRFRLAPLLLDANGAAVISAMRGIRRNSLLEAGAGALVIAVVAFLGTLPPGRFPDVAASLP
jgi:putative copper resistance protein D